MRGNRMHDATGGQAGSNSARQSPVCSNEPIAVVGMVCRFPGTGNLDAFWRLLDEGGNAVSHGAPGQQGGRVAEMFPDDLTLHDASRFGAFLPEIDRFDAEFFRISPLEVESLEPMLSEYRRPDGISCMHVLGTQPGRQSGSRRNRQSGSSILAGNECRLVRIVPAGARAGGQFGNSCRCASRGPGGRIHHDIEQQTVGTQAPPPVRRNSVVPSRADRDGSRRTGCGHRGIRRPVRRRLAVPRRLAHGSALDPRAFAAICRL